MLGLTDPQLKIIMTAANTVSVERRGVFLERVAAMLKLRYRFNDDDVAEVTALALCGGKNMLDGAKICPLGKVLAQTRDDALKKIIPAAIE